MMKTVFLFVGLLWLGCVDLMAQACDETNHYPDTRATVEAVDTIAFIDRSLDGIVRDADYESLVMDKTKALAVLDRLKSRAYGYDELPMVKGLLNGVSLDFTASELLTLRKVKSIQVNSMGIFSYPGFACRFKKINGRIFFEKTAGSQRKSGYIYDNKPNSKVFLGGWSVNDEPQNAYGSDNSVAGMLYKIGSGKFIMLFVASDKKSFEIYSLSK